MKSRRQPKADAQQQENTRKITSRGKSADEEPEVTSRWRRSERMKLTKVQSFMLFSLGSCHEQFDKRFSGQPMALAINKADFIDMVHKAGIVSKKDRAVYKNLQDLEEKRFIAYNNKTLSLTKKGASEFDKTRDEMRPYLYVNSIMTGDDILKFTQKRQTVLKE